MRTFPIFISVLFFTYFAWADETSELSTIRVTDAATEFDSSGITAWPVFEMPLSAAVVSRQEIEEQNIHRLADVTKLDASTTDSYNAAGYFDYLAIRGFVLDNRYNYQRESLPISAATSIALENKEKIEILKGLSGLQSGASSPGGQVNYVVKRPTTQTQQVARTEFNDNGQALFALDAGGRVPSAKHFGYRVNVAHEDTRPAVNDAKGYRNFASLAGDWRLTDSVLEAEIEWSQKSQPTQAGMSLLGDDLPNVDDPRLNLNNQPWTKPVEFEGITGTLRYTYALSSEWGWSATVGLQDLRTEDRLAYANGCTSENRFDRYCSNGTFDVYDFRSEGEHRTTSAMRLALQGDYATGMVQHSTHLGVVGSLTQEDYGKQAYNYVGVGTIDGHTVLPENAATLDENTNREASQYDVLVGDVATFGRWKSWLGARYSFIHRKSERTDGSRTTDYSQNFPVPWVALGYEFETVMTYVSTGLGVESFVVPNKAGYNNRGEYLNDVTSRQYEIGVKGTKELKWALAAFEIHRPVVTDQSPLYQVDGIALHRGFEAEIAADLAQWSGGLSAMFLDASREDSSLNPSLNGKKPVNVPSHTVRANVAYSISKNLRADSLVSYEGERAVTADNAITLPSWVRWDAGLRYQTKIFETPTQMRFSVQNLTDGKYWKESPTQYGHIYLYAGEPRTVWLSLQAAL